jgi:hypothetical protein
MDGGLLGWTAVCLEDNHREAQFQHRERDRVGDSVAVDLDRRAARLVLIRAGIRLGQVDDAWEISVGSPIRLGCHPQR